MFLSTIYWMFLSYPITVFLTFLGTVTLTAAVYLKSLFRGKQCLPKLYFKESSLSKHVLTKCQTLQSHFKPPLWIRSAYVQSALGMCPWFNGVHVSRKYIQMQDGGVVSIGEYSRIMSFEDKAPVVIVVPGITGSKRTVAGIFQEAIANRMRPVIFNARGQNGNYLTTTKLQDHGDPTDLREVIQYLAQVYPKSKLSIVGIESGADLVMSYLGEFGSSSHLKSAVVISPSYDPETGYSDNCPTFFQILYLCFLKSTLMQYLKHFTKVLDMDKILHIWNYNQFVESVHCKLSGHTNCEEYWDNNSPLRDVDEIATPVLCISSLDDPMCSSDVIPFDLFTSSPNLFLVTTDNGGRGGFVDSLLSESWTATTSIEYIKTLLEFHSGQNGHVSR